MLTNLEPAREVARILSDNITQSLVQLAPQIVQMLLLYLGATVGCFNLLDWAATLTRIKKGPKGVNYYALLFSMACFLTAWVNRWLFG